LNKRSLWESLFSTKIRDRPVCHALVQDPKFSALLLRIDHDLAAQTRSEGCGCGGALHRADYPRKPRGCPREVRPDHSSRLSFCCVPGVNYPELPIASRADVTDRFVVVPALFLQVSRPRACDG
jgi:hypothetical protein